MQQHPEVDVVTVGTGWAASVIAQQLTEAGLHVVSLEQGRAQWTYPDFAHDHDELKYAVRYALNQDLSRETWTFRPHRGAPSLPLRQWGSQQAGNNIGGAGVHWSTLAWRLLPSDFPYRSRHIDRYGQAKLPEGSTIQDWPLRYEDLEPFYDRWEHDVGVSGAAGNLGGRILEGGNPFEGPRARPYPLPPLAPMARGLMFADACRDLGYHSFPTPSAILSRGYTDRTGQPRAGCLYCGYCSSYGCEVDAKASPLTTHLPLAFATGRYEIRTHSKVVGIEVDNRGRGTGLRYMDGSGREHFQPAARIFLAGWALTNARLLLLSRSKAHPDGVGNNRAQVGRNYTNSMNESAVTGVFPGRRLNLFMANSGTRQAIADFYGDVWDHSDVDFIGGAWLDSGAGESTPINTLGSVPLLGDGGSSRQWGQAYKDALYEAFNSTIGLSVRGEVTANEARFLDLDPVYTDVYGLPLLRITYDWTDNDRKMYRFMAERLAEIMQGMGPSRMSVTRELSAYSIESGDNHMSGGAIMGDSPANSVTNKYGQVWDAPNVFVTGSSLFPQLPAFNPTETIGALSYYIADAVKRNLRSRPAELMT